MLEYLDKLQYLKVVILAIIFLNILQASNGVGLMFIALGEFTTTFSFEKITGYNQTKFVINIPQILILTIGTAWLIRVLSWFVWALTEVKCLKKLSTFCISSTFFYFV